MMDAPKYDVVIIGAGISGLALAYYLKKAGKKVLILESSSKVGGYINTENSGGFVYENGPNSFILSNDEIVELLEELALNVEISNPKTKERWILKDDRWLPLPLNPLRLIKSTLFNTKDKLKIFQEPFKKKTVLAGASLSELIKDRFGISVLDYALRPFVSGVYAGNPDHLSAKHAFPSMHEALEVHGSIIKGMMRNKKAKESSGSKANRATVSLEGGLENLIHVLHDKIGTENVKLNVEIKDVKRAGTDYLVEGEVIWSAKKVVSTIRSDQFKDIFKVVPASLSKAYLTANYAEVVQVILGFNNWEGLPLNAFGGLIPPKEGKNVLGVIFLSSLFKNRAPERGALLTVFLGGTTKKNHISMRDDEIKSMVTSELTSLLKMKNGFNPDFIRINKIKAAIPQYDELTKNRIKAKAEIESSFAGIYLLSMLTDGIGIPDRVKAAKVLSEQIIQDA